MATKTFKIGLSATDKQNMAQDVYERVLALTFAEYDSSKTYNTGDFVVYNDALYKCKEDSVTGTWDSSKWEQATLQDLVDDVQGAVASVSGKANTIDLLNGTLVPAKSLVAEQIENVSEDSGTVQDKPFTFQATATDGGAGASDTAPTAKYLKLLGKTYVFNQNIPNTGSHPAYQSWTIDNSQGISALYATQQWNCENSFRLVIGHKYLLRFVGKISFTGNGACRLYPNAANQQAYIFDFKTQTGNIFTVNSIESPTSVITFNTIVGAGTTLTVDGYLCLFDLTQMFNGDIPDAILNGVELEDYNLTFTGVDIFNQLFPLPYYDYNAGSLVSANATKLTTLGKNQFDGALEQGGINLNTGAKYSDSTKVRSTNFIRVVPKQKYILNKPLVSFGTVTEKYILEYDGNQNFIKHTYLSPNSTTAIQLTSNTQYVKILFASNSNISPTVFTTVCLYISWDETRKDNEEYVKHEYALGSELEEHPLLSAGSVCDEKLPNGTITRRIGVVDLETLNWQGGSGYFYSSDLSSLAKRPTTDDIKANMICSTLPIVTGNQSASNVYGISLNTSGTLVINNPSWSNASQISGKMCYGLDTPTEEQGDSFPEVIEVDDFGTMEYGGTNYNGYPQGCEFFYPADYVLFVDTLGNSVEWEAGNIATKNDLKYHELDSANVGEITTTTITTGFYKNSIAITSGLSTAIDVRVQMSNGAIYPAINNGGTELVIFNDTNFQTAGTTVVKVYWKN